jgi:hypothetical protein
VLYREIGPRGIASPALGKIGYYKTPKPDGYPFTPSSVLIGDFPIGKSALAMSWVTHLTDPRTPNSDATCPLSTAKPWDPRSRSDREIAFREFAIPDAQGHRPCQTPNSDIRCHLSSPQGEAQHSDTCLPLSAIGKSRIAISPYAMHLTPEIPKCRIPTPRDLSPRVPPINGSDHVGKSPIAISLCKRFSTPETPMPPNTDSLRSPTTCPRR